MRKDEWIEYHRQLAVRDARRAYVNAQLSYSDAPRQAVVRRSARKYQQPEVHTRTADQAWRRYRED